MPWLGPARLVPQWGVLHILARTRDQRVLGEPLRVDGPVIMGGPSRVGGQPILGKPLGWFPWQEGPWGWKDTSGSGEDLKAKGESPGAWANWTSNSGEGMSQEAGGVKPDRTASAVTTLASTVSKARATPPVPKKAKLAMPTPPPPPPRGSVAVESRGAGWANPWVGKTQAPWPNAPEPRPRDTWREADRDAGDGGAWEAPWCGRPWAADGGSGSSAGTTPWTWGTESEGPGRIRNPGSSEDPRYSVSGVLEGVFSGGRSSGPRWPTSRRTSTLEESPQALKA